MIFKINIVSKFYIKGGTPLEGKIAISGAKNSILPILAASILTDAKLIIKNVPNLTDVHIMISLLKELGSEIAFESSCNIIIINAKKDGLSNSLITNKEGANSVRASSLFMGPLLARTGQCLIPSAGGCKIGNRMLDLHFKFLVQMGATQEDDDDQIILRTNGQPLKATQVHFTKISVGATQNLLMAAILAKGQTTMINCAMEPEVSDLINFLITLGANISGIETQNLTIEGIDNLGSANDEFEYTVMNDRVEAGSYALAALITRGEVLLDGIDYKILNYFFKTLEDTGAIIKQIDNGVLVRTPINKILHAKSIVTAPYPYFPTDLQQIFLAFMTTVTGTSSIEETLFENRFNSAKEMLKLGAKIYFDKENSQKICIEGADKLHNSKETLCATDLRGGMSLIALALGIDGDNIIVDENEYIARGYENLIEKFKGIGAIIAL